MRGVTHLFCHRASWCGTGLWRYFYLREKQKPIMKYKLTSYRIYIIPD